MSVLSTMGWGAGQAYGQMPPFQWLLPCSRRQKPRACLGVWQGCLVGEEEEEEEEKKGEGLEGEGEGGGGGKGGE